MSWTENRRIKITIFLPLHIILLELLVLDLGCLSDFVGV
jgi:hypothetical protein